MGKQGPCCHCGISTTPLWRNGPPEKPVLCNACGSRWRTKGTLANYMPMHSGGCGANASLEYRWPRGKKTSQKIKEQKSYKKKEPYDILHDSEVISSNQHYVKNLEEDASTRSSSVSCLSYSEGSMHHPVPYDRYNTVTGHSSVWDSPVPSRKRTCMSRQRPSSLDKLTKSVHVPQGHESSYFSGSSEENLLYESRDTMDISEIGLGGVFVRQSNSFAREEESEASSLLIDSKGYNVFDNTHLCVGAGENTGQIHGAHVKAYDQCRAVKDLKRVMQCCHPPLVSIVLEDVFNFETFMETFKAEEQQWLMKYLSSVDVFEVPGSLKHMFESSQFKCALSHFQHLLSEDVFGIFDSDLQVNQLFQQLLIVIDLISSKWLERYSNFKKHNRSSDDIRFSKLVENKRSGKTKGFGGFASSLMKTGTSLPDKEITNFTGQPLCHDNTEMCTWSTANNERSRSAWANSRTDGISHESTDTGSTSKEADADHKSISSTDPNSLFISNNGSCATLIFDSLCDFTDDDSDSVLLFNVPANLSFPQAELLHAPVFSRQPSSATNVTRAEGGSSDVQPEKNELNFEQCSEWSDVIWSPKGTESSKITPGDTIIHPSGT